MVNQVFVRIKIFVLFCLLTWSMNVIDIEREICYIIILSNRFQIITFHVFIFDKGKNAKI